MKKILSIIVLILAVAMCMSMFVACGEDEKQTEKPTEGATEAPAADENKVTVTWYEGSKELKSEQVDKGSKLTSWTPTSDAGEFDGWYAEASKTTPFDFKKEITEDTDIFAKFKSNEFVADANEYYLIGTGAGSMKDSAWDHAKSEANLKMTKEANDKANIYTITIDMYAGDMFQICFGGAWDGQQGIGFMKGAEYCDGVNFYDNAEYTAADKKVAQVKNDAGEVVFIGSDEYNKGFETWNIKLAEGMDGKYKFTFTTNPAAKEYNQLTYELVEKIEPMATTHDMHFIGTMNEWSESFEEGELALKASEDGTSWSGFITITEDMYADWTADEEGNLYAALKIFNAIDGQYYGIGGENILLTAGTYAFKYTVEGNAVEYAELDYYVVGTFVDAEGKAVNFSVKEGVTPKLVEGTVTFTAEDVTALGDYSWMKDQGKPGVFAAQVVYGCELGIKDWYKDTVADDNFYLAAGECTATITIAEDGTVTASIANN